MINHHLVSSAMEICIWAETVTVRFIHDSLSLTEFVVRQEGETAILF